MKITNISNAVPNSPAIVTIGMFDGVHIGHQKIIKHLIKTAKKSHLKSVILTFFPHPRMVLQKDTHIKLINTINERAIILNNLGLDYLLVKKFTKTFSRLSAEDFVRDILVEKLKAKKVIIGYDHRFGRNRNADINDLKKFGAQYGFEVEEISAQDINDVAVSSTKIRKALEEGNIDKANAFLGYPFMLTGKVVKGKALGRQIDYPTANIQIAEAYKLIPKHGSYVVRSIINKEPVYGMMNIGVNPTVGGKSMSIEIYFLDFNDDLYDQKIQVSLLQHIRSEEKFGSVDLLKSQLEKDKNTVISFLKNL